MTDAVMRELLEELLEEYVSLFKSEFEPVHDVEEVEIVKKVRKALGHGGEGGLLRSIVNRLQAQDSLNKLYGHGQYGKGNLCYGDGYYAKSLERRYGMSIDDLIKAIGYDKETGSLR
jgi:hypothetical protein